MNQSNALETNPRVFRNPLDRPIVAVASRFGDKSKEVERFLKFAIVGTFGAVVDSVTLLILQATILPPSSSLFVVIATTIAFIAAISSNFTWNRFWTYPDSRSRAIYKQLIQFAIVNFIGWIGRTVWIGLSYAWLGGLLMPILLPEIQMFRPGYVPSEHGEAKLGTMAAWFIGVIIVMVWNFFANRYWTYNDVE